MVLKICNREEIEKIYNTYLVQDFPKDEVKPLERILFLYDKNLYFAYGLYDADEKMLAYAFFSKAHSCEYVLLDYYAVAEEKRGTGIGSHMLSLLKETLCGEYEGIILESENPDFAENAKDFDVRSRRIQFYLNNGFSSTKMLCRLFGVEFRLFVYAKKQPSTLSLAYAAVALYKALIEKKDLKDNISLRIEELF